MNAETLKLLQKADDPDDCEFPDGFDWRAAIEEVRSVQSELEAIVGCPFGLDDQVQDASFFADLWVSKPGENYVETVIAVRFSSFGRLFTVRIMASEQRPTETMQQIIKAVEKHGYHYVDSDSLDEPYAGTNPAFVGSKWCYRFFDYL